MAYDTGPGQAQPRAFNAPAAVLWLCALLVGVHVIRALVPTAIDDELLGLFAFVPVRYDAVAMEGYVAPGGLAADIWTFLSYAFLHGDVTHLMINVVSLLAFGSPVAWRFGPLRFLAFAALCAIGGVVTHLALHFGEPVPVIGASAAISGLMAAAIRFVFQPGAPLGLFRVGGTAAFRVPALPFAEVMRDRRVVTILLVWLALNLVFGLGATLFASGGIAWEAHVGGLVAGFLLFAVFDPVKGPGERAPPLRVIK